MIIKNNYKSYYFYKLNLYSNYKLYLFDTFSNEELSKQNKLSERIRDDMILEDIDIFEISIVDYLKYIRRYAKLWIISDTTIFYIYHKIRDEALPLITFYENKEIRESLCLFLEKTDKIIYPEILLCYILIHCNMDRYVKYFIPIYINGELSLEEKCKNEIIIENIFDKLKWKFTKLDNNYLYK
jgi:hypothetical protein